MDGFNTLIAEHHPGFKVMWHEFRDGRLHFRLSDGDDAIIGYCDFGKPPVFAKEGDENFAEILALTS